MQIILKIRGNQTKKDQSSVRIRKVVREIILKSLLLSMHGGPDTQCSKIKARWF